MTHEQALLTVMISGLQVGNCLAMRLDNVSFCENPAFKVVTIGEKDLEAMKVAPMDQYHYVGFSEPVLQKLGFVKSDCALTLAVSTQTKKKFLLYWDEKDSCIKLSHEYGGENVLPVKIRTLHQLQNLFRMLTGVDLDTSLILHQQ